MFYGTQEEFIYTECESCRTLQIQEIPDNLSQYYPPDYLGNKPEKVEQHDNPLPSLLRAFLREQRLRYVLNGKNLFGKLINALGKDYFPYDWDWFRVARVAPDSRILDVGCGPGLLLEALKNQGFVNIYGVDPFQKWVLPSVKIYQCALSEMKGVYDFIMLHHSFEHMPNPLEALIQIKGLCAPNGRILIRIPVANCHAWQEYGINWFQIDAPRHLVIPSIRGMEILADRVGLRLQKIVFDSDENQFCCSEQYKLGISLKDPRSSYQKKFENDLFTHAEMESFIQRSVELNERGQGDQACFYFENSV